jgi:PAS domain S-box-containing protein
MDGEHPIVPLLIRDTAKTRELVRGFMIATFWRQVSVIPSCPEGMRKSGSRSPRSIPKETSVICWMFCERENSMSEEFENREQLLDEISSLRQRVKELEVSVASHKQSEKRYRRLYDRVLHDEGMDGYAAINMDGYFRVSNAAFRNMVGYTAEELRGMIYLDLTPEKWRETERVIIQEQVLSENFSQVYEKELRRKDGSVFLSNSALI